jgi:hypothetical protein
LAAQVIRGVLTGIFHSAAGSQAFMSLSVFSAVSSVSTMDAEEPRDCGFGVFRAEEGDGVGDKGSGDTTMVKAFLDNFQT